MASAKRGRPKTCLITFAVLKGISDGRADVRIDALKEVVADTHEGVVTLSVPASSGFDLSTDLGDEATLEESIDLSSARRGANDYRGSVRGGGPLLRFTSHEGRITLRSQ